VRTLGCGLVAALAVLLAALAWSAVRVAQTSTNPWQPGGASGAQRVLILGFGGGQHPGAYLSDSMLLVSVNGGSAVEVSIPRDLWVQLPPDSGRYAKINEALQDGYNAGGLTAGGEMAAKKVEQVTGLQVTGWILEDFQGFRRLIDALGGVDVDVEGAFTAQYPVNDDPEINASWKTIHFDAGRQHMDGERALQYARARYSEDPREGTDFARSARQQRLVSAIKQKLYSPGGAVRFVPVANAASGAIRTNLSTLDLVRFVAGFHPERAKHITLDTSNVLVDARSTDGQQILLPRGGNYGVIADFVHKELGT
jgi:LCP family protein required for cell wall assembly